MVENIIFKKKIYFAFVAMCITNAVSAQVTSASLAAIGYNGNISIRVDNISNLPNYFLLNNGYIDIDFYFDIDDPRNGIYSGSVVPQPGGQAYIRFPELPYQQGDTLTFIATESLSTTNTKHYVFVRGEYFPESGGPINVCPRYIECRPKALIFSFNPDEIVLDPSSATSVTVIIPAINMAITRSVWSIYVEGNGIQIKFIENLDCNTIMNTTVIFMLNGFTCIFENGILSCDPLPATPEMQNPKCEPYFDNCMLDIISLIDRFKYDLSCRQWRDYNICSTTSLIDRPGRVAIGTSNYAENSTLTVKNGIITDKLKLTSGGWADYVFENGYQLMPLNELEVYLKKYGHLPNVPSAKQIETSGSFDLGEITIIQQEKIEEIFLHLIELDKETREIEAILTIHQHFNKVQQK